MKSPASFGNRSSAAIAEGAGRSRFIARDIVERS